MEDDEVYHQYLAENVSSEQKQLHIIQLGKACWNLLGDHEVVKDRPWHQEMVHKDLLATCDRLFLELMTDQKNYFLVPEDDTWDFILQEIMKETILIFDKYVQGVTWKNNDQRDVRKQQPRKLEWIYTGHQFHYAPPLPIMTSSVIVALRDVFKRNESAIREVSFWFNYNDIPA